MHSRNPFEHPRRILAFLGGKRIGQKLNAPVAVGGGGGGGAGEGGGKLIPAHTLRSGDQMPVIGTGWCVCVSAELACVFASCMCAESVCVLSVCACLACVLRVCAVRSVRVLSICVCICVFASVSVIF